MGFLTLDPTFEGAVAASVVAPRPASLSGLTIGLLDNSKKGGRDLLGFMEDRLRREFGVADVQHFRKPNLSAPAPAELMDDVIRCDAVITAIGD